MINGRIVVFQTLQEGVLLALQRVVERAFANPHSLEQNKLTFPVLSDYDKEVATQFGIVFQMGKELSDFVRNTFKNDIGLRNWQDSWELPVPATYVVDSAGVIRFARVEVDFMMVRTEPAEVVAALQAVARK
jgi:peroxiredoxin